MNKELKERIEAKTGGLLKAALIGALDRLDKPEPLSAMEKSALDDAIREEASGFKFPKGSPIPELVDEVRAKLR